MQEYLRNFDSTKLLYKEPYLLAMGRLYKYMKRIITTTTIKLPIATPIIRGNGVRLLFAKKTSRNSYFKQKIA